jgi:hypothetical protein
MFVVTFSVAWTGVEQRLPVAERAAATLVDHERRVEQLLVILEQPVDAIGWTALLVRP